MILAAVICGASVAGWIAAAASAAPNTKPASAPSTAWVQGHVRGAKFAIEKAYYGPNYLLLRSNLTPARIEYQGAMDPNCFTGIQLDLPSGALEGRAFVVTEADDEAKRPQLWTYVVSTEQTLGSDQYFQKLKNVEPYTMTLKFFGIKKGLLPGYIELHGGRERHLTILKGYFYAQPQSTTPTGSRTR